MNNGTGELEVGGYWEGIGRVEKGILKWKQIVVCTCNHPQAIVSLVRCMYQ